MRNFIVTVNGTTYEVAVEEIDAKAAEVKAAAPAPAPAAPKAAPKAGDSTVNAPMPGNILAVNVKAGDAVKKGQCLMILEAMKMENEILAAAAGTVADVFVTKGSTVAAGQALCSIR